MNEMDVIFKMATSPSLMSFFLKEFQILRTVKNPSHGCLDGIDIDWVDGIATLDELDEVSNLNHSICFRSTAQSFSRIIILDVGSIIYIRI